MLWHTISKYTLEEKPHKCQECETSFRDKGHLKNHVMKVHTGERPFKCTECEKAFVRKINLNYHMKKVHTGERPYKCVTCNKSYILEGQLKYHNMKVHNAERPYKCFECNEAFMLKSHEENVPGRQPLPLWCLWSSIHFEHRFTIPHDDPHGAETQKLSRLCLEKQCVTAGH